MPRDPPTANPGIALLVGRPPGFTGAALCYGFNTGVGSTRKQAADRLTGREPRQEPQTGAFLGPNDENR